MATTRKTVDDRGSDGKKEWAPVWPAAHLGSAITMRALAEAKIVRAAAELASSKANAKLRLIQQKELYLQAQLEYELAAEAT